MSENNETKKITIPFQSDDSEFDNFFGFRFGMSITDVAFKCLCYGMDILGCAEKRKNITMLVENSDNMDIFFYDCTVHSFFLSFKFYKGEYYLVRMIMQVKKNENDSYEKLGSEFEKFVEKFASQLKIKSENQFIHKSTKREFLIGEDDNLLGFCISEKGAEEYTENELDFSNFFAEKCFRQFYIVCSFSAKKLLADKFNTEELRVSLSGLLVALYKSEHDIINFVNFFITKNHIKCLPDLAKEIKDILKSAPDYNDEKAICREINNFIENRKNEILADERQRREQRKAEKLEKKNSSEFTSPLQYFFEYMESDEEKEDLNQREVDSASIPSLEEWDWEHKDINCYPVYKANNSDEEVIKKFFNKWNEIFSKIPDIKSIEVKEGYACWFNEEMKEDYCHYSSSLDGLKDYKPIQRIFHCLDYDISIQSRDIQFRYKQEDRVIEDKNGFISENGFVDIDDYRLNEVLIKYTSKNGKVLFLEFSLICHRYLDCFIFKDNCEKSSLISENINSDEEGVCPKELGYSLSMSLTEPDKGSPTVRLYTSKYNLLALLNEIGYSELAENFVKYANFLDTNAKLDDETKKITGERDKVQNALSALDDI